jgi:hypothetical protein
VLEELEQSLGSVTSNSYLTPPHHMMACSQGYVLTQYLLYPNLRTPVMTLLFYRTLCDFGIGFRFLISPLIDLKVCNSWHCDVEDIDQNSCAFSSAVLEFLEISSEAWFLCLLIDLVVTMTNPFSPFKKRLAPPSLRLLCSSSRSLSPPKDCVLPPVLLGHRSIHGNPCRLDQHNQRHLGYLWF